MAASEAAPGGRRRYGGLLRQRSFRLFWIGETVNQLGSAMALIGMPLLAVLSLHATTFDVGALAAAAYLGSRTGEIAYSSVASSSRRAGGQGTHADRTGRAPATSRSRWRLAGGR